tara:strand:- start:174 stop:296 length:123 start_codon:yes stop_codon:yes gene_type:complete
VSRAKRKAVIFHGAYARKNPHSIGNIDPNSNTKNPIKSYI